MLLQILLKCLYSKRKTKLPLSDRVTHTILSVIMLPKVTHIKLSWYSSFCSCFGAEIMDVWVHARQINYRDTDERCLHPYINLAPEFFTSITQNVAWSRRQECFPLWNHLVAVVMFDLSLQRKPEVQFIWNSRDLDTHREKILRVFLRAHSFSPLSWGHWCRRRSGFGTWAANYHFLLNWQCPTCGDPRAGMKCRWGSRCGICWWAREGKLEVGSWTSLN